MKLTLFKRFSPLRLVVLALMFFYAAAQPDSARAQTALVTVTTTGAVTIATNIPVPNSSGTTYVLQKAASGKLTLNGQITGGAGSILRTTTDTSGDKTTVFEFVATNTAYTGSIETWRGVVQVDNTNSLGTGTIYCDANASTNGDLSFANSMTFTNPIVFEEDGSTISTSNKTVTLSGPISSGGNAYGFIKYGSGTLTLSGANTYGGTTVIGGSSAAGGTLAIGVNNGVPSGKALTINNISGASVFSLGTFNQNVGTITLYAGSATRTIITGTGTLQMSGNLTLVDAHTSSQDFPLAISASIDLNGATHTFAIGYGNNQDSADLGDLHLNGVITNSSGTAGIIFTNYNNGTAYYGAVTLGATNTYNGSTTLAGGAGNGSGTGKTGTFSTLALNANNAIPNNSAFIQSANTILDLTAFGASTGITTGMGSLTGAGTITLGSAGILTIGYDNTSPAAYSGAIGGAGGAIVKTGTGTLTLSGANTYTGATTVSNGTLQVNGSLASGSAVTVVTNGTLNGAGTIGGTVTVQGGGTLAAGTNVIGTLTISNTLTFAANSTNVMRLNKNSGVLTNDVLKGMTGVIYNGTLVATATGDALAANDKFTLFNKASGSFSGSFANFNLPALSSGLGWDTSGLLVDGSIKVVSTAIAASVTWVGVPTNNWDLSGSNVWVQTGAATPANYTNGDAVVFDDTATNFTVNLKVPVAPNSVQITNNVNDYTISGAGGITNNASLTKQGAAKLTLATTNTYTGSTTISAGTLALGASGAIPGGVGNGSVTVNGTLDVAGYSPTVNNLAGTGTVDNVSASGSPVLSVYDNAGSTFSGTIQNTSGSLAINKSGSGTLALTGGNTYSGGTTLAAGALSIVTSNALGNGALTVTANLAGGTAGFLTVATNAAVILSNNISLPNASGTYVLTKNASGQLTLGGNISGGGAGMVLQTATDIGSDKTTVFEFAGTNSFGGGVQLYRGVVQADNPSSLGSATIYGDGNASTNGDLNFANSMTFTNPLMLQAATTLSPGTNNVTMSGNISGTATLTKYGSGALNLSGSLNYNGGLVVSAGTVGISSVTLAGDTTSGGGLGATYTNYISIASGATLQSSGTLSLYESSSLEPYVGVTGAGTLLLTGTNNNATNSPDISFAPNDTIANSTANWGDRIAAPVNLGSVQRYIWGRTDHTSVDVYGCLQADCQFGGPISGSGGLTFIAQNNSVGTGTQLMETPFCLNATNTFTGPVEIQRGSVYLGTNVNASVSPFPSGNVLRFNVASGNNGKFFLYGHNTTVSDLSSTGAGTALIANGNRNPSPIGPATLTVTQSNPASYSGSIIDTNLEYAGTAVGQTTTLSLVKNGPAALTLTGTVAFSGTMKVNAGELFMNTTSSGGGAVTVNSGGILGGNGVIAAAVTVSNGAAIEAGGDTGMSSLSMKSLVLGAIPASDATTLSCEAIPSGINSLIVQNANGFTNNSTVTVNVTGVMPALAPTVYTLISYSGEVQGGGSFVLGSVPDQAVAYITNNTAASAIQLVVSSVTIPAVTWVGSPTNNWDLLGSNVWVQTGTSFPAAYAENDEVFLDDTATNFGVNLSTSVSPDGLIITNNVNSYTIFGNGSISGYTGLSKSGTAALTLATSNNYSGPTVISAGTLAIGATGAVPGGVGAGNVTVNGTLDVASFNPTLNNLSGGGFVDDISAGGSPILNLAGSANTTFSGAIQNTSGSLELNYLGGGTLSLAGSNTYSGVTVINSGTLQVGVGGTSGTLGAGTVLDMATLAFNRSDSNNVPNDILGSGTLIQNGTGITVLNGNLTYTGPTIVNAGTLVLPHDVTYDAGVGTTLTVASNAVAATGFEIFLDANSSSVAVDISGAGTTRLISTLNRIESYADMVIGANNNGVSTANYGIRIASGLDLGSTERLFWAYSSRDDVSTYGLTGCDCQFAGPISGTAQLQLLGENSWPGVNTMEEQFAFNAANTWTGPLEVLRGSVYLGNAGALTNGNVLILDPAASVNSRFFLYGFNASVSDLQSGGYGSATIADGNNLTSSNAGPATLTVTENNSTTFGGNIVDWFTEYTAPATGPLTPTLSLVKNGAAALTLAGANTYSGTTVINAGKLYVNNSSTGGGAITVNTNATLGGSGIINSAVTVKNGGAIETGDGTGNGNTQIKGLALGSANGDLSVLNLSAAAILNVTNNNGLVLNGGAGSVTVNVGGTISSLGGVPLITYKGALGGTGFAAFQLGSTPAGVLGYLSNDTANASVDFVATQVTIPRWTGSLSYEWSTNTLGSPKNWILDSDGVTPLDYIDGENVKFDDTAASPTVTINVANVSPHSVVFNNSVQTYFVNGIYGITGMASLTKQGSGQLMLGTTNSYSGNTTITAGKLTLGAPGAIPGGAGKGNVTVNGTLDVGGFSATINNLSGSGIVDNSTAGGSPVLTVNDTISPTFAGVIKNTTGTLGLTLAGSGNMTLTGTNTYTGSTIIGSGTLTVNGSLANGGVTVQNGAALGGTGSIAGSVATVSGSSLNLTANLPLTVGALTLNGSVSVNVSGNVSVTNTANYVLLNHGAKSGSGSFLLAPVAGISGSGYSATLNDTNNQLLLVVAPTAATGTIADVRHVVIFMQENRSFDHYFGSLHGVHGFSDHIALTFTNGKTDFYQPSGSSYELPFHTGITCLSDLNHSWSATQQAIDSGKNDGWIAAKGTETMAYYNRSDLSYYYSLADNFTICDEYHCSILSSTDPNRVFLMTGFNDPNNLGGGPLIDNTEPANGWGTNWVTYPELLQKAGVTWKIFQASDNYDDNALNWFAAYKNAAAGTPLYNNGETFAPSVASGTSFLADYTNLVTQFKNAVISNTLPSVSWIIGPDVGSEHPSWSPEDGEILTKGLLDALASNPKVYNSTVFILNYDENDGFYDHAVPINPPAGTTNEFDSGLPYGLGVRVPCIIISPWSVGGYVCSQVFDHTSVIRFLEKWTGVQEPNISAWRRQVCGDLTSALDFAHPNTNYPSSLAVATQNDCASGTTATPPGTQTVPVQEAGTLLERPLPYQPNATPVLNCGTGNFSINMTNSGASSVHFSVYPNAYRNDGPWPYDVASSNSTTSISFSTGTYGGEYDFSCYGPNGFLRRFAGNLNSDCGQVEAISYLNPSTGGVEITLANPSASSVVFSVTNGYVANSLVTYTVPANSTNVVALDTSTNNYWYDLTTTASSDALFVRRFAGHIETNSAVSSTLASSKNASGYKDSVTLTATITGYGTPTGTVQFNTNGVAFGSPVAVNNGAASLSTTQLLRGTNLITAVYSGDLLNQPVTNPLSQVVTNHPPVANLSGYSRPAGFLLRISLAGNLSTNWSDVDGDTMALTGGISSTNGATVNYDSHNIYYSNSNNVADQINYTVGDGNGGLASGVINVSITPASTNVTQNITGLIPSGGNLIINFASVPNSTNVVEWATNLFTPVWTPIGTNIAGTNGLWQFIFSNPPSPSYFRSRRQ
jgi:phospholipase C